MIHKFDVRFASPADSATDLRRRTKKYALSTAGDGTDAAFARVRPERTEGQPVERLPLGGRTRWC
ncbi:MAG TPA: hypothetical protein VFQ85_03385 [Mycobacteriales bacterium]|jgi:hypothetical protein|nr:hypothetical protein [Mycobacteriales bacterium]